MDIQSRPLKISKIAGKAASTRHGNGLQHEQCLVNGLNRIISGGFTLMQLQELQQQALIYKYMEAGFPIPFHLIMPIWKSVNSLSSCQLYPSLLGYGTLNTTRLDNEPGRCRRTDGKRWRCSKSVVRGHKYCERHMHRNRDSDGHRNRDSDGHRNRDSDGQRSRKHAETLTNSSSNLDNVEANLSVPWPTYGNISSQK